MNDNAYNTAFKLLTLGFSVIPSGGGDKHNRPTVNWLEYQQHKPADDELEKWNKELQPRLWGIVTGAISSVVVIDADTIQTRKELELELGQPNIITPRGGGHWYFKHPGHPVKTCAGIIPSVDCRGDGGFASAIGSRPDGEYQIITLPHPDNLIPWEKLPARIKAALNGGNKPREKITPTAGGLIPKGERNAKMISLGGTMRRAGLGEEAIYQALLSFYETACEHEPPMANKEIRDISKSAGRYEQGKPQFTESATDYIVTDIKGNQTLDLAKLTSDILAENTFATLNDTDEILIYRDGYYQNGGARYIKAQCQLKVGITPLLTEHKITEIIGHIARSTYTERALFNANKHILNLKNGLLDVRTRKLLPHTPQFLSTVRIPVKYDPAAGCPTIKKFLSEVHKQDDIPVVQEEFGYILIPDNTMQKAILKVGPGENGKSTELNLERAFVGKANCSNVSWHKLEMNRFALSALEGKLVNIFADLPSQSLNMTTAFKMLTGGDAIGGERKFKDQYSFTNFARLIFSTNKPPKVYDDDSYAFWRRWLIIEFPNQITEDKKDKNILEKLNTDAELSGLLNWALDGLNRLLKQQAFSYDKTVEQTTEYYLRAADPVYAFLTDRCEANSSGYVPKDDLYNAFLEYAGANSIPILRPNAFARALTNQSTIRIRSTRPIIEGKRVTAWEGLNLVKDVKDVKVSTCSKSRTHENTLLNIGKNIDNPDGPPSANNLPLLLEYPHDPCPVCKGNPRWLREASVLGGPAEWVCSRCHPKPA